jgi:hypothetical protein
VSTDRDVTRIVRSWLEEGAMSLPDRVLDDVLDQVPATSQRRARWPAWRSNSMITPIRLAAAAAVISLVAVVGGVLPRGSGPGGLNQAATPPPALPPTACPAGAPLESADIATIAGTGVSGSSGDGGMATAATFSTYAGTVAVDAAGSVYFPSGGEIRRIGLDGIISPFADRTSGATITGPAVGIAFDANGDLLAMDWGANRIWRIDQSGKGTAIAGTGRSGALVDGAPALDSAIGGTYLAVGPNGDLYFDGGPGFATIDTSGKVRAFAGTGTTGFSGDGGPATAAQLSDEVEGVVADDAGNVYLADANNHRIRKVDASGVITTVVGTGEGGYAGDGGPAIEAQILLPMSLALGPDGSLYISDQGSSTIRRVDPAGIITTVAGTGVAGYSGDCGPASAAQLSGPYGITIHDGVLYIVDGDNGGGTPGANGGRIRIVVP